MAKIDIEAQYQSAIDAMTPAQRVAKAQEMFNWAREFLGRQIRKEHPEASIERVKLLVALRMYGSAPSMDKMIRGLLENVPD